MARTAHSRHQILILFAYTHAMSDIAPMVALGVLAVNFWTVIRFWQDKRRAQKGHRRIAEADLLGLALIGGSPGALFASHLFRHKTKKEPFRTRLYLILAIQLGLVVGLSFA